MVEIHRIAGIKRTYVLDRMFTEEERRQAGDKVSMLAGDFAVKEAVAKALGTGFRGFGPEAIEVRRDALGKPYVCLFGGAKRQFECLGGTGVHVSISDTKEMACAFAVIEA